MNEESFQVKEKKINSQLESMSKEEVIEVLMDLIRRNEEIENGSKLLATHLKVLCYKNGGSLSYTKEEFDLAAQEDSSFSVNYEEENKKEVCLLRLQPRKNKKM